MSELAQACMYQWSIEVKLNKIGDRYIKPINSINSSKTVSRVSTLFDFNLTRSTDQDDHNRLIDEEVYQSSYMRDIMKLSQPAR